MLVASVWKAQACYPTLLEILVDFPVMLKHLDRLILASTMNTRFHGIAIGFMEDKVLQVIGFHFMKWVCWCRQRGADPISGPISNVVNFLAQLYKEGYQYRSLNSYRSAISSVHTKVEGYSIGEHPLVTRLLKGEFNQRPLCPRYETTLDVAQVTEYLEKTGENGKLTPQQLSWNLATLFCLTRPLRSSDLCRLDLKYRWSQRE